MADPGSGEGPDDVVCGDLGGHRSEFGRPEGGAARPGVAAPLDDVEHDVRIRLAGPVRNRADVLGDLPGDRRGSATVEDRPAGRGRRISVAPVDRKSTRLNSSHEWISYAVFCLKKK